MAVRFETAVRMLAYLKQNSPVELKTVAEVFDLKESQVRTYCRLLSDACIGEQYGEIADIEIQDDEDGVWIETRDSLGLERQIRFTPDESVAIIGGLKYLEAMPFLVEQKLVSELLLKLQSAFVTSESIIEIGTSNVDQNIVAVLKSAISGVTCVQIKYGAAIDQKVTDRIIEPIALQANEGVVYVRAFCRNSEAMRTFRVDRIISAQALSIPGNSQETANVDFAITSPTVEARLRMLPEMVESFAPETVTDIAQAGNLLEATVKVTNAAWLTSLVMASAGDIEVLSPADLRKQVVDKAKKWAQV